MVEYAEARKYFASALMRAMKAQGLTPGKLSDLTAKAMLDGVVSVGVHTASVNSYTEGRALPSKERLAALALVLGMQPADLLPAGYELTGERPKGLRGPRKVAVASFSIQSLGGLANVRLHVSIHARMKTLVAFELRDKIRALCNEYDIEVERDT